MGEAGAGARTWADGTIAPVHTVDLSGNTWTVRTDSAEAPAHVRARAFAALVPGCVHTDLLRAGAIPDPLVGTNERETLWIGECDWVYERTFTVAHSHTERPRLELVCDGLDTIAELHVNGTPIGTAANMHHPHRFDLRAAIQIGENRIAITFRSPLKHIRTEQSRLGPRPVNGDWDPYIFIRKQASSFGWDWAPKLPTSGIWRPLQIEAWSIARIASVRPQVMRLDAERWRVSTHIQLEWADAQTQASNLLLGACLRGPDNNGPNRCDEWDSVVPTPGQTEFTLVHEVDRPRLWWPRGYGQQPLYALDVALHTDEPREPWGVADGWNGAIGFREVRLRTDPDAHGTSFELIVNGRPIFCHGANWIPEGPYAATASDETVRQRVQQAASMGLNMLRVWGGGIYESDEFYKACDEVGILLWQDFMFACAMYPEEPPYPALIEAEARQQVSRLSPHPSVALWCGGNECTWAYEAWGNAPGERPWKERLDGRTWGRGYYLDLLPRMVKELDPTRPYWPNSPWPGREGLGGNSPAHGDRHTWDLSLDGYTTIVPRFVSEFGHQSPPARATLLQALTPEDLTLRSAALEHHQRATGGTERHINAAIRATFGEPRDFDQWHLWAQLLQARAVYTGFAWVRVNRRRCMGALVWQLNDCWPGMSWSLIDSAGIEKPAAAAARHALLPRQLFLLNVSGSPHLYSVNDTDEPWDAPVTVQRLSFAGEVLAHTSLALSLPARAALHLGRMHDIVGSPHRPSAEFCTAAAAPLKASAFYVPDKEREQPAPLSEIDALAINHWRNTAAIKDANLATLHP